MQLVLNETERKELTDLIRAAHTDLGSEIHHAERQYRETLRERRALLEQLLQRLDTEARAAA